MKLFSNKYRIIITLISTMLIGGCDFKELAEGEIASTIYESIKVDKTDLNFKDLERTKSVIITANCKWTITNCPKWIHPIPTSGNSGERVVEIRVDEPVDTVRSASIHIEGDLLTRELFIKQDGRFIFDVRPLSLDFSSDGGADSLHIDCNTSWEIKNQTSWCHLPTTRGTGNKTLTITCKENTTNADRYDIISVSVQDSIIKIPVLQSGGRFYITIIDDHINIDKDGGSKTIYVQSNIDWLFKRHPANGVSVATVKPINNNEVSFTVENNPYPVERYDTIVFYGEKYPHVTDTVYIRQSPQPAYLKINGSESTITQEFTNGGGSKTFSIESNSEWKAEVKCDDGGSWCRISSPANGASTGKELILAVDNNPIMGKERSATVTLTTTSGSPSATNKITVKQAKGDPAKLKASQNTLSFNNTGETKTFIIESNINWTINGIPAWCKVSPEKASGNKTVTVIAEKNTEYNKRIATLTIGAYPENAEVQSVTVSLSQDPRDPSFLTINKSENPNPLNIGKEGGSQNVSIESNEDWEAKVTDGDSWCRIISSAFGLGNGNLTLSIDTNPIGSQARTAIIQVTTTSGSPKVERIISVTQEKGTDPILRIQDNVNVLEFIAMGETRTLTIESNIDWKIAGVPNWCEVSPTESTGTKTMTLTAKKNTASSSRSTTLTISASPAYPNVSPITITLNQGTLDIPGGDDNPDPHYTKKK